MKENCDKKYDKEKYQEKNAKFFYKKETESFL